MSFIEFLLISLAPSLPLGIIIFCFKNWFLERLKNSIKHEYDLSLEKFKGEIKFENDQELEEIKALLKKQTDVNLEDYRFKIELRKKWLNDVREASIEYLFLIRGQINTVQEYVVECQLTQHNLNEEKYKTSLAKVSSATVNLDSITFKIETLIFKSDSIGSEILKNMAKINDLLGKMTLHHHSTREPILSNSERYIDLQKNINAFKINIMSLLKQKNENL
ncbi:hypothetical protein F900_01893 [Acinetobacter modestus]|uniref:Uncharacterized protein n=1 Tax=Acinetobacter modestus TaxID=1776740 RepID=N9LXB6_9GAMM|nr:resistance protein Rx N-terminal domain-containing protein [Acinetobacter modestus]ENX00909.1 hypothetical protein F900_01893 [Acinetobacter modestus]